MITVNEREQAFEDKYSNDQETLFKVHTRAVRGLGFWAAEKLGLTGDDAISYAETVVAADFSEPGLEDVYRKLLKDFNNRALSIDKTEMESVYQQSLMDEKMVILKG